MSKSKYELTKEGFQKLEEELEYLKTVKRKENIAALQEARAQGDLSENAEYDAARDEQAQIESRIVEIESILRNAKIIEGDNTDIVKIGKEVVYQVLPDGETFTYHIVGSEEADPFNGKLSVNSPIAKSLVEHRAGDTVKVTTPSSVFEVKILEVRKRS